MDHSTEQADSGESTEGSWFEHRKNIDGEWAEVSLTTCNGDHVSYRIPRRTLFKDLDEALTD
ncbi:hypothetical protein SAMN04489727_1792 [Amycolatopsis tolypomycina]|uniref:Uncharacterized protein n=1 Tax=Amycolatopsis tolypomycina TaxID=208445 RepID=A0A1H4JFB3_9PSEU|nr:hypothetical protein [Amycolatopsis tolypomycina]SEB44328.1 hypothetical protein SAMN04489727_1792 [Amycolatopsis tolypomycina]